MKIAHRNDWKTEEFPDNSKLILVDRAYSKSEFEKIIVGTIPEAMEDKWFVFYEEPWLYFYRSWTGFCIFKVRFEIFQYSIQIAEAWVNRNPEQYTETDDSRDVNLLKMLLDYRAGYDTRNQMISYAKSLSENK